MVLNDAYSSSAGRDGKAGYWRAGTEETSYSAVKENDIQSMPSQPRTRRKCKGVFTVTVVLATVYLILQYAVVNSSDKQLEKGPHTWAEKQQAVKNAFEKSWDGYRKYAWGKDEYHPLSKTGRNMGPAPLGWVIVDSLDTMKIMGLDSRLEEARSWVKNELSYDMNYEVNTFETTIRMIGGLLSAYYLTQDKVYATKAADLGERILGAFDSESGVPFASVNLHTGEGIKSHADAGASSTAEASTIQLELKYLSHLTGDKRYWDCAERVIQVIEENKVKDGLVPIFIQPDSGKFQGNLVRLGSRGDSYYEYLLKQYVQTNYTEHVYKSMYDESIKGIKKHLVAKSSPNKLTYLAELDHGIGGPKSPKMDHLVCFAGGMLALGATKGQLLQTARRKFWTTELESEIQLAKELTRTCHAMYTATASGLAPEIVHFNTGRDSTDDMHIKYLDAHNLQRPETVESLFVLWRTTKDPIYREWGWSIFKAFEKWTKLEGDAGYTSLQNVKETPPELRDNMESFWLSETLKYLYLLFEEDDDLLPLDKVVFNTEGHPFPVFDPNFTTGWRRANSQARV